MVHWLSNNIFFKIFVTKIMPVLMYGAELWGTEHQQTIERVHYYACKRYMCARLNCSNGAVVGDCGRLPMCIVTYKLYSVLVENIEDAGQQIF